jgi:hypothetical protein
MRYASFLVWAAAAAVVSLASAGAAESPATPSTQAVKAAADATRAAREITMKLEARNGSGLSGNVQLYKIGRTSTRIVVRVPKNGKYRATLYPGTDCIDNRSATQSDVALAPTNFNTSSASMSSTIVALPIEKVQSNYVVDVRKATERAALTEACAHSTR